MKNVTKLSEQELYTGNKTSWHDQYKDSAWIFIGGLPYDLTEGDIICIFSQYGEIVNINLIRDKDSGKSKGFGFLCYEDQRSTVLAVDNFNGIKILNRTIRVDHVSEYKVPKEGKKTDEETKKLYQEGCAPKAKPIERVDVKPVVLPPQDIRETLADQIVDGVRLPARLPIYTIKQEHEIKTEKEDEEKPKKKDKKDKKKKKSKKKKKKSDSDSNSESDDSDSDDSYIKRKRKHKKDKHESRSKR